MIPQQDGY